MTCCSADREFVVFCFKARVFADMQLHEILLQCCVAENYKIVCVHRSGDWVVFYTKLLSIHR